MDKYMNGHALSLWELGVALKVSHIMSANLLIIIMAGPQMLTQGF